MHAQATVIFAILCVVHTHIVDETALAAVHLCVSLGYLRTTSPLGKRSSLVQNMTSGMPTTADILAPITIDELKEHAKNNKIITQLFPQLNESLNEITEENIPEDMQMFLRPDEKAHDRFAQLEESHPDGYSTISEMIYALTGEIPTPEFARDVEWFMQDWANFPKWHLFPFYFPCEKCAQSWVYGDAASCAMRPIDFFVCISDGPTVIVTLTEYITSCSLLCVLQRCNASFGRGRRPQLLAVGVLTGRIWR